MLHDGVEVTYDYLVVATGTKSLWVVPGAKTFWGPDSEEAVAEITDLLDSVKASRVILTMPDLTAWQLPVYELALYLAAIPRDDATSPVTITIASPEKVPLESFGEQASRRVASMLAESQVEFLSETVPVAFEDGSLTTGSGDSLAADAVINLPSLTGHRLGGLAYNENGFIEVNPFSEVEGLDRVYAIGDVTDFPVKFGSLATGQADVAAASIAAHAWGRPEPGPFQPRLSGILLTADGPVLLDSDASQEDRPSAEHESWDPSRKIYGRFLSPFLASIRD
ncbi:MAG: FAD-dependent oxidoreductase [Thermoleophilia bacterium]|nr:FAD-dependent oxidoreductase [Thermoleophilia bacterium]